MKAKRVLALLLSIMLIAASLPLSAVAATQEADSSAQVTASIDVTVNKEVGSTELGVSSIEEYGYLGSSAFSGPAALDINKESDVASKIDGWKAQWDDGINKVNGFYTGKSTETVKAGDTVYVGVKFGYEDKQEPKQNHGMIQKAVYLTYSSKAFEYDGTTAPVIMNQANARMVLGPTATGITNEKLGNEVRKAYGGDATLTTPVVKDVAKIGDSSAGAQAVSDMKSISVGIGQANGTSSYYLSEKTTWDLIVPLKVIDSAVADTYKIGVQKYLYIDSSTATSSVIQLGKTAFDGTTGVNTNYTEFAIGGDSQTNPTAISLTEATVIVKGTPKKPTEVTATYSATGNPILTLGATAAVQYAGMEISANGGASWAAASAFGTVSQTTNANDTLTFSDTYRDMLAEFTTPALKLRSSGDTEEGSDGRITDVALAHVTGTNTAPTFKKEGTINMAATSEYAVEASKTGSDITYGTYTAGTGSDVDILSSAGKSIKYRVKGDTNGLPSASAVGTIPSKVELAPVDANNATAKQNGLTKITPNGVDTSTKFEVATSKPSNTAGYTGTVTQAMLDNGFEARTATNNKIYFLKEGVDGTSFNNEAEVTASGNAHGTVTEITGECDDDGDGTVTVTLVGDTFANNTASNWGISGASGSVTVSAVALSNENKTATLTVAGLEKGKELTLTIQDAAFSTNGKEAASKNKFTISDEGYQVALVAGNNADGDATSATFSAVGTLQPGDTAVTVTISG